MLLVLNSENCADNCLPAEAIDCIDTGNELQQEVRTPSPEEADSMSLYLISTARAVQNPKVEQLDFITISPT